MLDTIHSNPHQFPAGPVSAQPVPAYRKEMGARPADLFRLLPGVAPGHTTSIDEAKGRATITDGVSAVIIDCEELPNRQVGALSLPVTRVSVRFIGYSAAGAFNFMTRFDRAFLRMGG